MMHFKNQHPNYSSPNSYLTFLSTSQSSRLYADISSKSLGYHLFHRLQENVRMRQYNSPIGVWILRVLGMSSGPNTNKKSMMGMLSV